MKKNLVLNDLDVSAELEYGEIEVKEDQRDS